MSAQSPDPWAVAFLIVASAVYLVSLLVQMRRARAARGEAGAGEAAGEAAESRLRRELAIAAEAGGAVHIALGSGGLASEGSVASIAALRIAVSAAETAVAYGLAPTISVGDPTLLPAAQDALRNVYERQGIPSRHDPTRVNFVSPSALGYAAGVADTIASSDVTVVLLSGSQSHEVALTADPGSRGGLPQWSAFDSALASAVSFPATDWLSPGEGLYAAAAQEANEPSWVASLASQDVARWILVAAIAGAAIWSLIGG